MAIIQPLRDLLNSSELSFEEVRAFETGLAYLTQDQQKTFVTLLKNDPELIYPLYINFKAKLRAAQGTDQEWETAIETEIVQLEDFIAKRRVGDEIM
ncbi:MAG: hypothetical protein KBC50_01800 [Candidatus Pacebacteria bacterium]|jgi:hypothetical protein|nr:hypothetical protein [Candidatus Paceibacterota bacterium]